MHAQSTLPTMLLCGMALAVYLAMALKQVLCLGILLLPHLLQFSAASKSLQSVNTLQNAQGLAAVN